MSGEIPDGVTVETVWAAEGTYAPDAAERRPAFRAEHLERIARLLEAGTLVAAGAFTDWTTSLMLIRAADEAAARDLVEADVYFRNGIWTSCRVRPFGAVKLA
jgi:uncharacterized protein